MAAPNKSQAQLSEEARELRARFAALEREQREYAQTKEFLRESEAQNRALLEGAVDGIITLDERGIMHAFNPAAERIFGYTAEQVIGHNVEMLIPLPYNENHDEYLGHYLRTNETRIIGTIREVEGKRQDGTTLPLELSVSEIVVGQERMFLGILHDISERKRAEEMVRKKQTELAHIMRLSTLSEMASGLAHELNQPLSAIMTYVETCKMDLRSATGDRDELRNDLERIATLVERMAEIIGRLRDFVRKRETRQTPVDLNKLVQDVIRFVDHELRSGEAKLRLDLETTLPDVLADAIQIQQVILNLVLNALEAMVDCPVGQRELTVRTASAAGDVIEVAVCDTGPGVPPESTDRLFEPFFTSKPNGVGMGLSISQSIIEAHGGLLTAMPNSDRGMTFGFTLKRGKHDETTRHSVRGG